MDFYDTYVRNAFVRENSFLSAAVEEQALPTFEASRPVLPQPFWEGHATTIECYWKTWELAFKNLRRPLAGSGFIANYIDTAFNDHLFMWDSAFIVLFARYGQRAFNFQRTLDNLYARQHPDGFICREIREADGQDRFHRFDPASTGPNILPWAEWEYFLNLGDRERLAHVFPVLVAYHQWLRTYRTWPDGSYWSSGWGCGMDNQPRLLPGYSPALSHGHQTWVDTCFQQILSARLLIKMAEVLGRSAEVTDLQSEVDRLIRFVNEFLWNDEATFYFDRRAEGSLSDVKTIGAFWALLADAVPLARVGKFVQHLSNPAEFNRPHRVPTLSTDHPQYRPDGDYWLGSVWAPTNYMVLRGLSQVKAEALAHEIALNHLHNVVQVFEQTGTLWENYAPEASAPGNIAKKDFVGWTGLPPVAVLFEYLFGLRPSVMEAKLTWTVRLLEEHSVSRYPFGPTGLLDLHCAARSTSTQKPVITASSTFPVRLEIRWEEGVESLALG